ncbi:unnamed protein product [Absidia cylindrospora]
MSSGQLDTLLLVWFPILWTIASFDFLLYNNQLTGSGSRFNIVFWIFPSGAILAELYGGLTGADYLLYLGHIFWEDRTWLKERQTLTEYRRAIVKDSPDCSDQLPLTRSPALGWTNADALCGGKISTACRCLVPR